LTGGKRQTDFEAMMITHEQAYTEDEHRNARKYVADILSIEVDKATAMLQGERQRDALVLLALIQEISGTIARKWNGHLLVKLPITAWEVGPAGQRRITPLDFASMRYLSPRLSSYEEQIAKEWMAERERLMRGLHELHGPYAALTEWKSPGQFKLDAANRLPFNGDIAFAETVVWLENLFNNEIQRATRARHDALGLPDDKPLPLHEETQCTLTVLESLKSDVKEWVSDSSLAGVVPDSVRARLSANLAVNRALWETCAKDARGEEATLVAKEFLSHLNACDVIRVPDAAPRPFVQSWLTATLTQWFGAGGRMKKKDAFFERVFSDAEINTALELARSVQRRYIVGRGAGMKPGDGEKAHGSPENLFIFVMATLSVYYVKGHWGAESEYRPVRVPREFRGDEKRSSKRYPASSPLDDEAGGGEKMLRMHAEELIEQVYGLMFFGNEDWDLLADKLEAHAEKQAVKRACTEQLLEFAVKGRSSQELLNLFTQVNAHVDRQIKSGRLVLM
jgi:hypothetical protein